MLKALNGFMITAVILFSCQAKAKKMEEKAEPVTKGKVMPVSTTKANLNDVVLSVKKDLVCGMPITAGIVDTAQFKGKVYGFCAAECKAEFLKDPDQYLTIKN